MSLCATIVAGGALALIAVLATLANMILELDDENDDM
jgi:hypothetical protein